MAWETETVELYLKFARNARYILDIGANTGVYTLLACAANPNAQLVSIEPVPRLADRLRVNIEQNEWTERCEVHQAAVSNFVGITSFHIPNGDSPKSASLDTSGFRGYEGSLTEVPVTTVDHVCSDHMRVDLVKIDVEGYEDRVLEGMSSVLNNSQPFIIVECNPDGPFKRVQSLLEDYGYTFHHIRREGLVTVLDIAPDSKEKYRNFLCCPPTSEGALL
jgi:FkbM family methyltransferase